MTIVVYLVFVISCLVIGLTDLFYWREVDWDFGPNGESDGKDPYYGLITIGYEFFLVDFIPFMLVFVMHHLNFKAHNIKTDLIRNTQIMRGDEVSMSLSSGRPTMEQGENNQLIEERRSVQVTSPNQNDLKNLE
eukprot:CAMPEP_0116886534 /NCGR_PEP_ID=MMETSP0463-20121206/20429_1 /TAXON_ID=181622 /ORGANISM="Strombidinopsis sp, Strain SopsisLIS2011" /LENGTH=133 /DNA_ID=CAMNT_0004547141 /DNA_START=701 /DNA_END=1102 /DNA_ORIENTATION=-